MAGPKLGEQVMDPPGTRIIKDQSEGQGATTPSGLAIPSEPPLTPDPNSVQDPPQTPEDLMKDTVSAGWPDGPTILLEDGARLAVKVRNDPQQWRVSAMDGNVYDHCGDTADGEWVYRRA